MGTSKQTLRHVKLRITSRHDTKANLIEALEVPTIRSGTPFTVPTSCVGEDVRDLPHADDADGYTNDTIQLLIGSDYNWKVTTGKIRRLTSGLTAVETSFGWTLRGPVKSTENIRGTFSTGVMKVFPQNFSDDNEKLSQQLQAFWEVEHMGILNHKDEESVEDSVLTEFK
ncbi:hypothetical protein HPB48_011904 [Haemaphysalis longicornis]|uniref:Peptidase aspartic putative domain-containing protein n=1 Tax=Haemaphysalis longicornis TaxID=44386 RepID=A0A9J6FS26_HAELO|nr:hypothetical protein HPB48_011904 [Haemaphysalis longicornis]